MVLFVSITNNYTLYIDFFFRNKAMEAHVTEKLSQTNREIAQLVKEEQTLLKKISAKSEHKKLSIF